MGGGGFYLLSGYAGTGKTYLMGRVLQYIKGAVRMPVALTCPTHKALKILKDHTQADDLYTCHSYLGMREDIDHNGNQIFVKNKNSYKPAPCEGYKITIVDEASMLDDVLFDEFEDMVVVGHKVIFVGDSLQIPPVNQANSLPFEVSVHRDLSFKVSTLNTIVRQAKDNPIIGTSMAIREHINRPVPELSYQSDTSGLLGVRYAAKEEISSLMGEILDMFASDHFKDNPDYVKIIAWTNATVDKYNRIVRAHLFGENIPKIIVGDKMTADARYLEGNNVLIKNNEDLEVVKAEIATDNVGPDLNLQVYKCVVKVFGLDGESEEVAVKILHEDAEKDFKAILNVFRNKALAEKKGTYHHKEAWRNFYKFKDRYLRAKYSYAITCHKSQGSSYDHAVVMMYDIIRNPKTVERNRILYTACTRPRYTLKILH